MTVQFQNYEYRYESRGKPIFVPSRRGYRIGYDVKAQVEYLWQVHPVYLHLMPGGHIAALHGHRSHKYFAKIDLSRLFYSLAKSRVQRALRTIGVIQARHYAKWSCVKNPYAEPGYVLPYGFVQSPILATLVLSSSQAGRLLEGPPPRVLVSVYVDDISMSSDSPEDLELHFSDVIAALEQSHFIVNDEKSCRPAPSITIFNCNLSHLRTSVLDERTVQFDVSARSPESRAAFQAYCATVTDGNLFNTE